VAAPNHSLPDPSRRRSTEWWLENATDARTFLHKRLEVRIVVPGRGGRSNRLNPQVVEVRARRRRMDGCRLFCRAGRVGCNSRFQVVGRVGNDWGTCCRETTSTNGHGRCGRRARPQRVGRRRAPHGAGPGAEMMMGWGPAGDDPIRDLDGMEASGLHGTEWRPDLFSRPLLRTWKLSSDESGARSLSAIGGRVRRHNLRVRTRSIAWPNPCPA